jgi:hypothetical protein
MYKVIFGRKVTTARFNAITKIRNKLEEFAYEMRGEKPVDPADPKGIKLRKNTRWYGTARGNGLRIEFHLQPAGKKWIIDRIDGVCITLAPQYKTMEEAVEATACEELIMRMIS